MKHTLQLSKRLLISAPNSGSGKTSVSLAIISWLKQKGIPVQTFKTGPDYLDTLFLHQASAQICYNLDSFLLPEKNIFSLVSRFEKTHWCLLEGAMGLYDGAFAGEIFTSTAHIAKLTKTPILLVVDVKGMAGSIAALVHGFMSFEDVKIVGVVANNCGSARHGKILCEALERAQLPPILATIPKGAMPKLPSRHLGLVRAQDIWNLELAKQFSDIVDKYFDIDLLFQCFGQAKILNTALVKKEIIAPKIRLGIAFDAVFFFYYQASFDELRKAGCELVFFSPLEDKNIPDNLDAVYIGGGYPESFAEKLATNYAMLNSIKQFAQNGGYIYAECGGLMYLCEKLQTAGGDFFMVGLFNETCQMLDRKKMLGYVQAQLQIDCFLGKKGDILRGHEYHYSQIVTKADSSTLYAVKRADGEDLGLSGFYKQNIVASYVHLCFSDEMAKRFVAVIKG